MNDETEQSEPKKLTPQELADKLDKVVDEVRRLGTPPESDKPENEWAYFAVQKHARLRFGDKETVDLPYKKVEELCPELFQQVIKPAIELANKKGELYKTPLEPKFITLSKTRKDFRYDPYEHLISFGIPEVRFLGDIDELIALTSHEIWHGFQYLQKNHLEELAKFYRTGHPLKDLILDTPNKSKGTFVPCSFKESDWKDRGGIDEKLESRIGELDADRLTNYRARIAEILSTIINGSKFLYDINDTDSTHPNARKRIKVLLEEALGNEIFGMNGSWQEEVDAKGYHFQPNDIEQSGEIIHKRVREQDYMRMKPTEGERITIDGRCIKNWEQLGKKIEVKAEELMESLDDLVDAKNHSNTFTLEKKNEWLMLIDKEVAEFRETNPPEFVTQTKLGGWASGIELRRDTIKQPLYR